MVRLKVVPFETKNKYLLFALITMILIIIVMIILQINSKNVIASLEDVNKQESMLLQGPNRPYGFTCGILTESVASELLESKVLRAFGQGPTDVLRTADNLKTSDLFWMDNCRYQNSNNSSGYVEMYVSTFQTIELAENAFSKILPLVNSAKEIPAEKYGQKLVYDAGVHYLLRDHTILQIAASSGKPQDAEEFSHQAFEKLISSW